MGLSDAFTTYNKTLARESMNNLSSFSWSYNITEDPEIAQITNITANSTPEEWANSIFTPINSFWAAPGVLGSYFYVLLSIFIVALTYHKFQSLHVSGVVMVLLSVVVAYPATIGDTSIPIEALTVLYLMFGLGIAGIIYSMFVGD